MSQVAQPSQSQQQQEQAKSPAPQRSKIVQRLMDAAASLPAFIHDILYTQATMVAGTEAAAFLVQRQGEQLGLQPVHHIRPDDSDQETRTAALQAFQNLVAPCATQEKDGAIEVGSPDGGDAQYCLVTVLRNEGQVVAATAVVTRCRDLERARQRLSSMQIVAGYFDLFFLRRAIDQARQAADRHQNVLQYTSAVATAEGFKSAASNLCNELANRTGATRVSLGWLKGRHIRIQALSHTERFDKKQELIVELEKVMEECVDQEEPVRFGTDGASTGNVARAARELSRRYGSATVYTLPLRRRDAICGALTLEFPPEQPLDEARELGIGVAAEVLAPQLFDRYDNDRNIFIKMGLSLRWLAKAAVGVKYWTAKLIILGIAAFITALFVIQPMYGVRAAFQLVAMDRRTVCVPFDGVLEDVLVRKGDIVRKGQVLARMRTYDLETRRNAADRRAEEKRIEAAGYRASGKPAEEKAALASMEAALAERELYDQYLRQAEIVSPLDGVVLQGEYYDRRGATVHLGDVVFEIAQGRPAEGQPDVMVIDNEVEMRVSERDIQLVKRVFEERRAQADRPTDGRLATSSFPKDEFAFHITRIVPAAEAHDGENVFRVYAELPQQAPWMHPGLAGEARVDIERKSLAWIYTHRLWEWLVLKRWHWMP